MRILSIALALLIGTAIVGGPALAQTKAAELKKCEAMTDKMKKDECMKKAQAMK